MKKTIILLLAILFIFNISIPVSAQESTIRISRTDFEDGSYCIITIITDMESVRETTSMASTITGTKKSSYYNNNNVLQFTVSVRGSFTYNGTTATATSSQYGYQISSSDWSFVSGSAAVSGATATATCAFHSSNGANNSLSVSLRCSPTGTLS